MLLFIMFKELILFWRQVHPQNRKVINGRRRNGNQYAYYMAMVCRLCAYV